MAARLVRGLGGAHRPVAGDGHNGPVTTPPDPAADLPIYPVGLRLAGRKVLVVGGGNVAQRRVPTLISAGAEVHLVSPEVTPAIEGLASAGEVRWLERGFEDDDLEDA